ncbi:MAG TPA: aldolase [Methylocella sp.]|nr:aldolase [Methylocella sp.]
MSTQKDQPAANGQKSSLHASAVVIGEAGVLISGPSGAGKSSLALALIAAAEAAGFFSRLIGDDRIDVEHRGGRVIACGHPLILGKIERRGLGICELPFLSTAVVRLLIGLNGGKDAPPPRLPDEAHGHVVLVGVKLPFMQLRQDAAASDLAATVMANRRLRGKLP